MFDPAEEIEIARQAERNFRMSAPRAAAVAANSRRTDSRFLRHLLIPVVAVIVGIIAGVAIGNQVAATQAANADWTVPPCSAYAFTQHPDLPAYTRTDACVRENPDGGLSLVTGDEMWKAAY